MTNQSVVPGVITPDDEARIADYFSRHGGPGLIQQREGNTELHTRGWWEVYAADGYGHNLGAAGFEGAGGFLE